MDDSLFSELTGIVLAFTSEMNAMEMSVRDSSLQDKKTDCFLEFNKGYEAIIHQYCTAKKRTYKREGYSLSEPYYCGIAADNTIDIELEDDKKVQLVFGFHSNNMGEQRYLFTLVKKKEVWKIDNVKRWSGWKKNWVNHIL